MGCVHTSFRAVEEPQFTENAHVDPEPDSLRTSQLSAFGPPPDRSPEITRLPSESAHLLLRNSGPGFVVPGEHLFIPNSYSKACL